MMKNDFSITVIIPLYSSPAHLAEALDGVSSQTIGMKNIQVILVNEAGRKAAAEAAAEAAEEAVAEGPAAFAAGEAARLDLELDQLCQVFQVRYPDSVLYIEDAAPGMAGAVNAAIPRIQGEFTILLDGDDTWEENSFLEIKRFFDRNPGAFDVCCCKPDLSGDYTREEHPLDYMFNNGARVVDLMEEPEMVAPDMGNVAIRSSAIAGRVFNPDLAEAGEMDFVTRILMDKPVLGILDTAIYLFRKDRRAGGQSAEEISGDWRCESIENVYKVLYRDSVQRFGEVLPFIQHVVIYGIRWRDNGWNSPEGYTEEENARYLGLVREILSETDDMVIIRSKVTSLYYRIYHFRVKYGEEFYERINLKKGRLYFDKKKLLFNYKSRSVMNLRVMLMEGDYISLHGTTRAQIDILYGEPVILYAQDDAGNRYDYDIEPFHKLDEEGYAGEPIVTGMGFHFKVPAKKEMTLKFYMEARGKKFRLLPGFGGDMPVSKLENSYGVRKPYIISHKDGALQFSRYSFLRERKAERLMMEELNKEGNPIAIERHQNDRMIRKTIDKCKLRNSVVFATPRKMDGLQANLQCLYDYMDSHMDVQKSIYARMGTWPDEVLLEGAPKIYSNKVIVTDDYFFPLRRFGKKPGQKVVQTWHACGAFKMFGKDGTEVYAELDRLSHKDYDLVTVSSEHVRKIYADAFRIPVEKVQALGVPRTDALFDEEANAAIREEVYAAYPEIRGKQVIVYAPTFRTSGGADRRVFQPDIDWGNLSESLREDQVFLVCPHPVMQNDIVPAGLNNIKVVRDLSTDKMMRVADLMITDYSSVIFEFSVFGKPIVFYCYDYDEYNRDFYLDYETDLPGEILKTQEELLDYLAAGEFTPSEKLSSFRHKFMDACDGHSTERVAEAIRKLLHEK